MQMVCRPRLRTKGLIMFEWRKQLGECRPRLKMLSSLVLVEYKPRLKTSCCWKMLEELLQRS